MLVQKYRALEPINYNEVKFNTSTTRPRLATRPASLACQACTVICRQQAAMAEVAITNLPHHLASLLLAEAIRQDQTAAIATIIANWPLPVLCFREVLGPEEGNKFMEEMGLDVVVFRGITNRTKKCRLRKLDLRGFSLSWNFTRLIVQMWPLLSLKKSQRTAARITKLVLEKANLVRDHRLASEVIPQLVKELLANDMIAHRSFGIHMPRGHSMVVLLDRLEFTTQNSFFMEYLITSCIRTITPVTVQATNIIIKSVLNIGDDVLDSLAPFIIFRNREPDVKVEGLCLENLEDDVFALMSPNLRQLKDIRALILLNCNICLQEGRTRLRTSARMSLTSLLSSFPALRRLDLSQNSFAGVLSEILDSLSAPLDYLSLRECDLFDRDMENLANSRHAQSLREINLSKICGLFPDDGFAVTTAALVRCLSKFPNLTAVTLAQNQITNLEMTELGKTISHWRRLRSLNIAGNILSEDLVLDLICTCTKLPDMQYLYVPYSHNLLEAINVMEHGRRDFQERILVILQKAGRMDIKVDITGLAYAVFANI